MRIRERFNPRAPCGARPSQQNEPRMSDLFQPTCLLRGATIGYACRAGVLEISTHAPLAGRDPQLLKLEILLSDFNPRAPCGARPVPGVFGNTGNLFQPTRPLRGATLCAGQRRCIFVYFNPRAPCGARRAAPLWRTVCRIFQPTRPLRGATADRVAHLRAGLISTHAPLAGRDACARSDTEHITISTHAPLAGRDNRPRAVKKLERHFNPRAPCGARLVPLARWMSTWYFNPRAPCGARPTRRSRT